MKEYFSPSPKSTSFPSSSLDDPISEGHFHEDLFAASDYNSVNNANLLRDIENLIQNMERKQTHDNDSTMLENIDNILSNIKLNESRAQSPQSNLSAEPIRTKSPIVLPARNEDRIPFDVLSIIDNIRDFVSNNIQDIVPDLVSQVEQELTTDLNNEVREITVENLDEFLRSRQEADEERERIIVEQSVSPYDANFEEFLRNRHVEDFEERNASPIRSTQTESLYESTLDDYLRHRHDEEFAEINVDTSQSESRRSSDASGREELHEFMRIRHDQEFIERNNDFDFRNPEDDASHDSITATSQIDDLSYGNSIVAAAHTKDEGNHGNANNANDFTNEVSEADYITNDVRNSQQLEPLKYKSSFNLKILKQQPMKRTKSERDFKKRNSLILENALLGRNTSKKGRPKSLILNNEPVVHPEQANSSPSLQLNDPESNINHQPSLISENIESAQVLSEINVSGSERNAEIKESAEQTERNINGSVGEDERNESLLLLASAPSQNEDATTTIEVDEITNEEIELSPGIINDSVVHEGVEVAGNSRNETTQSIPHRSAENETAKPQQNLSELVEDTQRLIKQMKDEINAIYVSDDDYSSSEGRDYSDDWVEGFEEEEEEYTDETESEYGDWSGEYEQTERDSEQIETGPEEDTSDAVESLTEETMTITESPDAQVANPIDTALSILEATHVNGPDDLALNEIESTVIEEALETRDGSVIEAEDEALDNSVIGSAPKAVSDTENAESVVHGKLELTPMSSNQFKVDANIEALSSASTSGTLNDDDGINLNNSTNLQFQEANDRSGTQESTSQASQVSSDDTIELMSNEITVSTNSIREIVSEAINDAISSISFDETENIVARGNDNNHPQIAGGSLSPDEHDSPLINSAMNKSKNITSEEDSSDDSIASGSVLNDDGAAGGVTYPPSEDASNAGSEEAEEVNDEGKSDQLKNEAAGREIVGVVMDDELEVPLITEVGIDENAIPKQTQENANENVIAESNASVEEVSALGNRALQDSLGNVAENSENLSDNKQQQQQADMNEKSKGAVAKSKIPSKVKSNKTKNSSAKETADSANTSEESKSKSSSPEKIKAPVKKQAQTSQIDRKSSFDNSVRKKSVPTPFGLLASSNVKSLQSQFLNKSNSTSPPKTQPTKLKPSKLVPPKALSKEPASTFANKLTKLITPSSNAKSTHEKPNHSESSKDFQRDHSKDIVPNKKYMEHCFSDEYPSTTDDEEEEEAVKAPRSFFIKKPPTQDSDDETSDVRNISKFSHSFPPYSRGSLC